MNFGRASLTAVLLSGFCLACFASDWEEEPGAAKVKRDRSPTGSKLILKGQVEHAEKLPALSDSLQAGANYQPQSMPQAKFASSWFKIPIWFAGTYESQESTIDEIHDYATGRVSKPSKTVASVGRELHGFQKDRSGDIWHFYLKFGSSKSAQQAQITFNNIDWYGPEFVGNDKVIIRVLASSFVVDRRNGVIVDSFRREDIKSYEPAAQGLIKVSYSSKSFDSHGRPRDLQIGHSIYHRIAPFQELDREGDQDYRQLFKDFLLNEHLSELLPK